MPKATDNIKYFGVALNKQMKNLFDKIFSCWRKKLKKKPEDGNISHTYGFIGLIQHLSHSQLWEGKWIAPYKMLYNVATSARTLHIIVYPLTHTNQCFQAYEDLYYSSMIGHMLWFFSAGHEDNGLPYDFPILSLSIMLSLG